MDSNLNFLFWVCRYTTNIKIVLLLATKKIIQGEFVPLISCYLLNRNNNFALLVHLEMHGEPLFFLYVIFQNYQIVPLKAFQGTFLKSRPNDPNVKYILPKMYPSGTYAAMLAVHGYFLKTGVAGTQRYP